jgi:hypothetical protein
LPAACFLAQGSANAAGCRSIAVLESDFGFQGSPSSWGGLSSPPISVKFREPLYDQGPHRVRQEYRECATVHADERDEEKFQGLVHILDKITDLKNTMRKADCRKIPKRKPPKKDEMPNPGHDKIVIPPPKNR